MPKGNTAVQRVYDEASNGRLAQEERPCQGAIQMAIHPDKSLPGGCFTRRWIVAVRKAAVQMPGEKQPPAWRVEVGSRRREKSIQLECREDGKSLG